MAMYEILLEKIDAVENFLDRLIVSDKCSFFLNDMVNCKNCKIWDTNNFKNIFKPQSECI